MAFFDSLEHFGNKITVEILPFEKGLCVRDASLERVGDLNLLLLKK